MYACNRSSHQRCSIKKGVLRNFAKFLRKHLCHSLFFNKVAGLRAATLLKKRLWHRCFPMNFAKFLRTPFLQNTSWRLLLMQSNFLSLYSLIKQFSIFLCSTFYFLLKTFFLLLMTYLKRVMNEYFRLETARLTKRKYQSKCLIFSHDRALHSNRLNWGGKNLFGRVYSAAKFFRGIIIADVILPRDEI